MVKQYHLGQTAVDADLLIGRGLFTAQVRSMALRSKKVSGTAYDDPVIGKDPQLIDMQSYVNTEDDWGAVHINSGIPNRAFYDIAVSLGARGEGGPDLLFAWIIVHDAIKLYGKGVGDLVASA